MNRIFNLAFRVGIFAFIALLVTGALLGGAEALAGTKAPNPLLIVLQIGVFLSALAWGLGTLVLWTEGWLKILRGWRTRSWAVSIGLAMSLIFFNVFAAYLLHIFGKKLQEDHAPASGVGVLP